jgi:hypothetical protein
VEARGERPEVRVAAPAEPLEAKLPSGRIRHDPFGVAEEPRARRQFHRADVAVGVDLEPAPRLDDQARGGEHCFLHLARLELALA